MVLKDMVKMCFSYLASTVPTSIFNNKIGWGAKFPVGMIRGKGFIHPLSPKQYLDMCPTLDKASYTPKYKEHLKSGGKFAPMWLEVRWQPSPGFWQVVGHDGRHRMRAIGELYGANALVPIKFFCRDSQGQVMTKEDFDSQTSVKFYNAPLRSQNGSVPRVVQLNATKIDSLF